MDFIQVSGIRAYGYTGYLKEEQVLGQWFEVNITLGVDLLESGISDDIDDTLDYRNVIEKTKFHIENSRFALVEKLAHVIATDILTLEKAEQVRVELSKLAPPIPGFAGKITIDITRDKQAR